MSEFAFHFDRHTVFGWVIHRKQLAAGESFMVKLAEDMTPEQSDNITLWTKGAIMGQLLDGSRTLETRLPGRFSRDHDHTMAAGTYLLTAKQDSEWWCINWTVNRKKLPNVSPLRLVKGQTLNLALGTKLLICHGMLSTPAGPVGPASEIAVSKKEAVALALDNTYGLYFHD